MSNPKTPTFFAISIRDDEELANTLLVVMLEADRKAGGKYGKAAALLLDLAKATGVPARLFVEGRSAMVPERWSESFGRLLDSVVASEKLRDHASSVVDDIATLRLIPQEEISALRAKLPKKNWRAAA